MWTELAGPDPVLLMLDFDGTLAPIAPHPDEVRVNPQVPPLLRALQERGDAVWLISGRRAEDVRRHVPFEQVVGMHGLEWPGEARREPHPLLPEARRRLELVTRAWPGAWVEDKELGLCLHVRPLPRSRWKGALDAGRAALAGLVGRAEGLRLLDGHAILELRPADATKARAVQALVERHPGHLALYVGDDETDEEGFAALPPGGLGVRVGPEGVQTRARIRVDDVGGVVELLHALSRRPI